MRVKPPRTGLVPYKNDSRELPSPSGHVRTQGEFFMQPRREPTVLTA